jgi:hypothetical protein
MEYFSNRKNDSDFLIAYPDKPDLFYARLRGGRPRVKVELVLHFLVLRGLWGSLSDYESVERLYDSKAVDAVLSYHGHECPGITTIRENLNAISNATRELILKSQAWYIISEGLDDFNEIYIDSTSVKGNTAYPTDISVLYKLIERVNRGFEFLKKFEVPYIAEGWTSTRIENMRKHLSFMSMQAGKQGVNGKVKESFRAFSTLASNLIKSFFIEQERLIPYWEGAKLPPVKEIALETLWFKIDEDLNNAENVLRYAELSINEGIKLPSIDKVLSISDRDAAFIKKGQRNPVIGYKPQIAKSQNGFICGYITPIGNVADSEMFVPMIQNVISITGITPSIVSVDDGYSSEANVKTSRKDFGISTASFSGSKGKKLTIDDWDTTSYTEARRMRSSIESMMFTIKFNHRFGILRRRNIDAVNAEQLEKIIAYNFVRIVRKKRDRILKEMAS